MPKPSTKVWIFVFLPPLDMPTALSSDFFPTIGTLMHLAGGRVNREVLKIRVYGKGLKYTFKNAHFFPFTETAIDSLPRAIPLWKFSPRGPSSGNPQYPIHRTAVITFCRASALSLFRVFWRQQFLDSFPLTFCEFISSCTHMYILHLFPRLCNIYFSNKP